MYHINSYFKCSLHI